MTALAATSHVLRYLCTLLGATLLCGGIFYLLTATPLSAATATTTTGTNVEQAVRSFFQDTPVMIEIARCESKFRQFADSGNVLRGGYGNNMLGVFQFNGLIHTSEALDLGFDLETLDGNLGYAKHLYKLSGTDPWVSSFACWSAAAPKAKAEAPSDFTELVFGQTHADVRTLQERLNAAGFVIADTGPGSVGNETTKFGTLTRVALRRFQCAAEIACTGDEYSTGYGLYNQATHDALVAYKKSSSTKKSKTTELSTEKRAALLTQIQQLMKQVADLEQKLAALRNV